MRGPLPSWGRSIITAREAKLVGIESEGVLCVPREAAVSNVNKYHVLDSGFLSRVNS